MEDYYKHGKRMDDKDKNEREEFYERSYLKQFNEQPFIAIARGFFEPGFSTRETLRLPDKEMRRRRLPVAILLDVAHLGVYTGLAYYLYQYLTSN
mgnify:CR=1 FL=1